MSKRTWNRIPTTPIRRDAANISWLTDTLATGGDLSYLPWIRRDQVQEIIDAGITHIIDMRIEDDDYDLWESHGIQYINLGTEDRVGHVVSNELFDEAVEFARLADEMGGKVLAHCHMGINRGPSAAAAILLDRGMGPYKVLRLIKEKRPIVGLAYFMDALEAHLKRLGRNFPARERDRVRKAWHELYGTPESQKHIMAAISDGHARDAAARKALS